MFKTGLVSVTFRKLDVPEIVSLCVKAGVDAIEWGGDVHVPHGDLGRARETAEQSRESGLEVAAYGSYYRLGNAADDNPSLEATLDTAVELGAPTVRVWAGRTGSAEADASQRAGVEKDALRAGELAAQRGLTICYEYHSNTLTDTVESTRALLEATRHPAILTLWQPAKKLNPSQRRDGLRDVLPRLLNLHVYQWESDGTRRPLAEGKAEWKRYLDIASGTGRDHALLLEFVRDDSPEAFLEDAAVLRRWVDGRG